MSETTEATQVLEGIKSLTAEEPPALDVQEIAEAAAARIIEALSAQPHAELERLPDAAADAVTAVMEKPTTVSEPETPVIPNLRVLSVRRGDGAVLLSAEVVSLLKASLKANLPEVTSKILRGVLED